MTFNNITASFRVTGIYPFDRSAFTLFEDEGYKEFKPEDLCRKTGFAHIPLYSPSSHSIIKKPIFINDSLETSSDDEVNNDFIIQVKPSSSSTPIPMSKIPVKRVKPSGGVITSSDYIMQMEEQRGLKEEKEQERERRKQVRERIKKEKEVKPKGEDYLDFVISY